MRARAALLRGALAMCVIAAAAVIALLLTRTAPATTTGTYSTAAASWVLPRLDGAGTVSLAQFRGRPAVVDFFASWCTSCAGELPEFVQVSQRVGGRVAFIGVDSEENGDGMAMARNTGITRWPLARDTGGSQLSGLRDALEATPGMPITAFYDAAGRLQRVRLGALSGDELSSLIAQLFGVTS